MLWWCLYNFTECRSPWISWIWAYKAQCVWGCGLSPCRCILRLSCDLQFGQNVEPRKRGSTALPLVAPGQHLPTSRKLRQSQKTWTSFKHTWVFLESLVTLEWIKISQCCCSNNVNLKRKIKKGRERRRGTQTSKICIYRVGEEGGREGESKQGNKWNREREEGGREGTKEWEKERKKERRDGKKVSG